MRAQSLMCHECILSLYVLIVRTQAEMLVRCWVLVTSRLLLRMLGPLPSQGKLVLPAASKCAITSSPYTTDTHRKVTQLQMLVCEAR